jgi:hypothetical protein
LRKCRLCRAVGENAQNKIGPQLNGLDGRDLRLREIILAAGFLAASAPGAEASMLRYDAPIVSDWSFRFSGAREATRSAAAGSADRVAPATCANDPIARRHQRKSEKERGSGRIHHSR